MDERKGRMLSYGLFIMSCLITIRMCNKNRIISADYSEWLQADSVSLLSYSRWSGGGAQSGRLAIGYSCFVIETNETEDSRLISGGQTISTHYVAF